MSILSSFYLLYLPHLSAQLLNFYYWMVLLQVVVTQLALSGDGSFMSTVEVRLPEEDIGGLVCLKFWTSDSEDKRFRLLTVIYEPHRCVIVFPFSGPITRPACNTRLAHTQTQKEKASLRH